MVLLRLKAIITEDHQLQVDLPTDIPPGEVEITLEIPTCRYTARQLMALPPDERDRIVAEAIAAAAQEDFEIFEAYSEEMIDDEAR